ncbi:MAG: winged helix-turn-helix transcriptional regulator [Firmicutes bacterium]|nr:winged helix-turn-helix transcriptional regulator [Bacillota bacterium]
MKHEDTISRQVAVFKALAHETRLRLVEILAEEGEKCVCDLVSRVGFDQSTISKHLSLLKTAGVVVSRKEGLNVIYRLRTPCVYQFMRCVDQLNEDRECVLVCPAIEQGIEHSE